MRNAVKNLALLAGACLFSLLLLELLLSFFNPLGLRVKGGRIILFPYKKYVIENTWIKKLEPRIVRANNSLGFRGAEPPADFSGSLTMLGVGSSTTESFYLSDGLTWPEKLGEELGRSFRNVWTNNAGMDGHTTFGHRALLDGYIKRLRPKMVIFLVGSNDMGKDAATRMDRLLTENGPDRPFAARLFVAAASRSAVVSLARNLYLSFRARKAGLGHREVDFGALKPVAAPPGLAEKVLSDYGPLVPAYRTRLEDLAVEARAAGIEPVFATTPLPCGSGRDPSTGADLALLPLPDGSPFVNCGVQWAALELYNDATRKAAASSGAALVDLAARLPKDTRYFYDFSHFTAEGTAEVARLMYAELCPRLAAEYPSHFTGKCFPPEKGGRAGRGRSMAGAGS